jgi:hypothetical protein
LPGIHSSRFLAMSSNQDTRGVPTPDIPEGLFSTEKKNKVLHEKLENINRITRLRKGIQELGSFNRKIPNFDQYEDSMQDQMSGKGYPLVSQFKGIKGKTVMTTGTQSSEKFQPGQTSLSRPIRSVFVMHSDSPLSRGDQNPDYSDSPSRDCTPQINEKNSENIGSPVMVTEKVRPRKSKLQTELLGDDIQDIPKNKNPFLNNKFALHLKDSESPDANEVEPSIIWAIPNLGIESGRTDMKSTTPKDSNISILPLSKKGPRLQRALTSKPSLFSGQGKPSKKSRVDNRQMYLTI